MRSILISLIAIILATNTLTAQKCAATTTKGTQCLNKAKAPSTFCKVHDPKTIRCAGTTQRKVPCRLLPSAGSKYCWRHTK